MDDRESVAKYYDATVTLSSDISFYIDHILPEDRTVLELGCGTGRVLLSMSEHCDLIVGVEKSEAMLDICRQKMRSSEFGNITLIRDHGFDIVGTWGGYDGEKYGEGSELVVKFRCA